MNPPINLDDYVDVPERIRLFIEKYPEGTLQGSGEFVYEDLAAGGKIAGYMYTARAYRHPEDLRPGVGTAFEKIPGATPYTRDSEVMNAETSAWGRAIVAVGIPSKRIASANEVAARREELVPAPSVPDEMVPVTVSADSQRTAAQNRELNRLLTLLAGSKLTPANHFSWKAWSRSWTQERFAKSSSKDLTVAECSAFIEELKRQETDAPEVPF